MISVAKKASSYLPEVLAILIAIGGGFALALWAKTEIIPVFFLLLAAFGLTHTKEKHPLGYILLLLPLVWLFAVFIASLFPDQAGWPLQRPLAAVGHSLFIGSSKLHDKVLVFFNLLLVALVGFAFGNFLNKITTPNPTSAHTLFSKFFLNQRYLKIFFFFLLFVAAAIALIPSIAGQYGNLEIAKNARQWDASNRLIWKYMILNGLLPFRDFWYPYAAQYLTSAPFPEDYLLWYVHSLLYLACFSVGVIAVCKGKWSSFFILLIFYILMRQGVLADTPRYVPIMALVLLVFSAFENTKYRWPLMLLATVLACETFFYEPNTLLYGLPGCLIILGFFLFRSPPNERAQAFRVLLTCLILFFSFVIGYLLFLESHDQLSMFISFYKFIGDQEVYSSWAAYPRSWFQNKFNKEVFWVLLNVALLFLAAALVRLKASKVTGVLLLAGASLCSVIFLKQIMRPSIVPQILAYPLVFLALGVARESIFYGWGRFSSILAASAIFCFGWQSREFQSTYQMVRANIDLFSENLRVLSLPKEQVRLKQNAFFRNYDFSERENTAVKQLNQEVQKRVPNGPVYVFGDDSLLYPIIDRLPPPFLTFYNTSPIYEQDRMIQWLKKNDPQIVIWNPDFKDFDEVPNPVRVPLLFNYVISNYEFDKKFGRWHVLRKRQSSEINMDYWIKNIGSTVSLGTLPALSSFPSFETCPPSESNCANFLRLKTKGNLEQKTAHIVLQIAGRDYDVDFNTLNVPDDKFIYLDRLWFWTPGTRLEDVRVISEDIVEFSFEKKLNRGDILY